MIVKMLVRRASPLPPFPPSPSHRLGLAGIRRGRAGTSGSQRSGSPGGVDAGQWVLGGGASSLSTGAEKGEGGPGTPGSSEVLGSLTFGGWKPNKQMFLSKGHLRLTAV